MSCTGCNDGCFDESVQLAQGPAGAVGPAGADGADGRGILSTSWTSNSGGQSQGTEGTTDTYTITYTEGPSSTFIVTNGADGADGGVGDDGVSVLDYRTADGGVFYGGVFYYPGIVQAAVSNLAVVQDASANNLQTLIPANTLQTIGDFLKIKLVVAVQSPEVLGSSLGAMQFSVWWDTTLIGSFNVGSLANGTVGSQGFEAIIDVAMVDNTLITTGNVQVSTNIKWFDGAVVNFFNAIGGNLIDGINKSVTINETLSDPHTIYVKAENPNSTDGSIVDLEESAGRFSNDAGYVLTYEVIKYKKQV